jgi:hypothetical protein
MVTTPKIRRQGTSERKHPVSPVQRQCTLLSGLLYKNLVAQRQPKMLRCTTIVDSDFQ